MSRYTCAPWLARKTSIAVIAVGLAGCSSQSPAPDAEADVRCADVNYSVYDPAEPVNRGIFAFNRVVDDYALAPVARGYRHLPDFFQTGVHNFVNNLPNSMLNSKEMAPTI